MWQVSKCPLPLFSFIAPFLGEPLPPTTPRPKEPLAVFIRAMTALCIKVYYTLSFASTVSGDGKWLLLLLLWLVLSPPLSSFAADRERANTRKRATDTLSITPCRRLI